MARSRLRRVVHRRLRSTWVAVLLVLLHVLAPGLHALQHRAHALAAAGRRDDVAGVAHRHTLGEATAPRAAGGTLATSAGGDDDCELCALLARDHGFVPVGSLPPLPLAAVRPAALLAPPGALAMPPVVLPPARGPPLLLDC